MIGALKGKIQLFHGNSVLLFASGVGYKVSVSHKTLGQLKKDEEVFLYIFTHVKEEALELYGFLQDEELSLFELLLGVSGVGPKTAMLVMEFAESQVKNAIMSSDVDFFTQIPRIGKKNAQKIIIELKSKVGSLIDLDLSGEHDSQTKEISEALQGMGFKRSEVYDVLRKMPKEMVETEDKIKEALKMLGGR